MADLIDCECGCLAGGPKAAPDPLCACLQGCRADNCGTADGGGGDGGGN